MIFKSGLIDFIYSLTIILAELLKMEIEINIHNIQKIANDLNGFTDLCFRNACNLLFVNFRVFLHL